MNNPNEPAYPSVKNKSYPNHKGITRREYFAAKAMQSYLSSHLNRVLGYDLIVKNSYEIADAMLKQGDSE